jgi:small-conductance mechanosensitive channel
MTPFVTILAATGRDTVEYWLRTDLVVIVMTISGAYLLTRLNAFVADQQIAEVKSRTDGTSDMAALTSGAHRAAAFGALRWGLNFAIVAVAVATVLLRLNLPSSALVFLGSIAGAGLGFGAQQMVGDIIAGIYIISERQFGVGDIVRVGPLTMVGWVEGRVEEVTLRVTKLRTFDGDLVSVANGVLRHNVNMSRDWSLVSVTVPMPRDTDLEPVLERLEAVCAELTADPEFAPLIVEAPHVEGVGALTDLAIEIRIAGRSLPVQQWKVERELRRRIADVVRIPRVMP